MKTDCLLIGLNDTNFEDYVNMVRSMGTTSGAFKDLNTSFIEYKKKPYRALDILTHFHSQQRNEPIKPFHNADFLWPTVLYLGTYLSRRGFSFDYVNLFQQEKEKLRVKLKEDDVLTVAITTTLYVSSHPILEIISFIRQINSRVKIIVGGPYIFNLTAMGDPESIRQQLKYIGADFYVISQEGEKALVGILNAIKNGTSMDNICNIAYQKDDGYLITPALRENNSLEENMVDYRMFPREDIGEFISLWTSKSCPFSCAFCGFPQRAGKYMFLDVDMVEYSLNKIRDVGNVTTLTFLDDTLNVPKERFKEILRMMIRNNYGFRWNCFFRCDNSDEETISLMRDAGCEGVVLGVESGNNEMLKRMNKKSRKEDYLKAIPLLKEAGIIVYAGLIIGFPGETQETALESMNLIEEAKPDFFRTQLWYCDPITPIWKKREEYGIRGSAFNWSHNTMDSGTAVALIENSFLRTENSLWLPQYGFELWSVFYLMRKGMTLEQVKTFIACFNATVKEKLLFPNKNAIGAELDNSLRQSCLYDQYDRPDLHSVTKLSGSSYAAAEKFWAREGKRNNSLFNLEFMKDGIALCDKKEESIVSEIFVIVQHPLPQPLPPGEGKPVISKQYFLLPGGGGLRWGGEPLQIFYDGLLDLEKCVSNVSPCRIIFSAFSVLLSRLSGQGTVVILFSTFEGEESLVIPVWLSPPWGQNFRQYVLHTEKKIEQAMTYGHYASYFFNNQQWMKTQGIPFVEFDIGFVFHKESKERKWRNGLKVMQQFSPSNRKRMELVLEIYEESDALTMQFSFESNTFKPNTIKNLSSCLLSLLDAVVINPEVLIGEIDLGSAETDYNRAVLTDSDEFFNF